MGSGSLAAMAVFEAGWKPNMTVRTSRGCICRRTNAYGSTSEQRDEALHIVTAAISAGIFNDLGSGSNVDACVITATHTEMLRNFVKPNERVDKERRYVFRRGTTAIKSESVRNLVISEEVTPVAQQEAMDTT